MGCSSTLRSGSHSKNGVSCNASANADSSRSYTWPKPSGTASGNSKATGQVANKTKRLRANGTNHRLRNRLQWSIAPSFSSALANHAPDKAPKLLSNQSDSAGTRCGR